MSPPALIAPTRLQVDGLCFGYPQRALLTHWSATIGPGLTLLRGDDGSGKTTLLRLLAGALSAHAGQLILNDVRLHDQAGAYRRQVFWVDPHTRSFDAIPAAAYFASLQHDYPALDVSLLGALTQALALVPHLDKPLYMLSTGTKRKVWLAAAFASGAPLTLLDEPFAALDRPSVRVVEELLEDAAAHPTRAWVLAHYEVPDNLALAQVLELAG